MSSEGGPIVAYTDGACRGNPGRGGWAWAVPDGPYASGAEGHTTNQRMEITAALEALRSLTPDAPDGVEVVSDSTYVVNCVRQQWYGKWLKNGWVNSQRKPVANVDLWKPFVDLYLSRQHEIRFEWVKGHSGNRMNDLVDQLAVAASKGPFDVATAEDVPESPTTLF